MIGLIVLGACVGRAGNQGSDVFYDLDPFCSRDDLDVTGLEPDPVDGRGIPKFAQWYQNRELQSFVAAVGGSGGASLDLVHGLAPDHRSQSILVSVNTSEEAELERIVQELREMAPNLAVDVLVRPTCVDAALAERFRIQLRDFVAGVPNTRTVDPLTGQLVIGGSSEAYEHVVEFLHSEETFSSLDSSTQTKLIRHVESSGPRRSSGD